MSIRHHASDVDELDDPTYRMLGSRLSRVAFNVERHELQRQRREYDTHEKPRKVRKSRERQGYE